VDDKVRTKRLCHERGISVPETFAVIEYFGDLKRLGRVIEGREQFVIKPASGSGGRGVLVIVAREGEAFVRAQGQRISFSGLRYHASTTLSGLYSLGGQPDHAIVEERIVPHPAFEGLAVAGTPDIRIIVYRGVPAMAMLRLPTKASGGRANLHQGAVAAGIDLETGRTFGGVCRNHAIIAHPDTELAIGGLRIPHWDRAVAMAKSLSEAVGMGYVGVDIVLDAVKGPVVLEANARPGLAVQIANRGGLLKILENIDTMLSAQTVPDSRMAGAAELPRTLPKKGHRAHEVT
jgi:alpha-L-glutamate ligase-like protein